MEHTMKTAQTLIAASVFLVATGAALYADEDRLCFTVPDIADSFTTAAAMANGATEMGLGRFSGDAAPLVNLGIKCATRHAAIALGTDREIAIKMGNAVSSGGTVNNIAVIVGIEHAGPLGLLYAAGAAHQAYHGLDTSPQHDKWWSNVETGEGFGR